MPKDHLSPAEEVRAFFSSVLNCFLYCHSCHPGFELFFILGTPLLSSLLAVQVALYSTRGVILQQSQSPRAKMGTGERARGAHGTGSPGKNCCWPESAEPSSSGASAQPELIQNQVMFNRAGKGQAFHTWTQPFKFNLLTAEYGGTWILWRAVMRALLKVTVCVFIELYQNLVTAHAFKKSCPEALWCFSTSRRSARDGNTWPHYWSSEMPFCLSGSVFLWECWNI